MQEGNELFDFQPDTPDDYGLSDDVVIGNDAVSDSIEASYSDSLENGDAHSFLSSESSAELTQNEIKQNEMLQGNTPETDGDTTSGIVEGHENLAFRGRVSNGNFDSDAYNDLLVQKKNAQFDMTHSSNYVEFDDAWHRCQEADKAMGEMIAESDSYKKLTSRIDRQLEEYQKLL